MQISDLYDHVNHPGGAGGCTLNPKLLSQSRTVTYSCGCGKGSSNLPPQRMP
ncbi:hypothetical protein PILCRDRAFT_810277 [Piloderma croceum F 1598]|uniref:Uncharacterized protein n=1 Tax=Piloderma croceum (strain F 1598) TaxID=765440 RepID=A0A0C3C092_PILCF|nr:hypothetical protein PILCRDRAFT_810277 [Piloderma croceum F 1598]